MPLAALSTASCALLIVVPSQRKPTLALYIRCVKQILWTYAFIIFPISFFNYYLLHYFDVRADISQLPSLYASAPVAVLRARLTSGCSKTMTMQILAFFVIEDVLQYFLHRGLHWGIFYKYIHKVHHHHPAPFGITAAYAHPLEVLILAIPTYGGPLMFRPHLCTMYLWILIRELDSVHTHCGYEFPPQRWLSKLLPFYGGAYSPPSPPRSCVACIILTIRCVRLRVCHAPEPTSPRFQERSSTTTTITPSTSTLPRASPSSTRCSAPTSSPSTAPRCSPSPRTPQNKAIQLCIIRGDS